MSEELTDFGWFAPGLEGLAPGLHASGLVYGIYCNKTDAGWVKVGSVNADRARENLRRDIYVGQSKYLFVLECAMHVAVENAIHVALAAHAHPTHKDCFSLTPRDLMQKCVEFVRAANERAIQTTTEAAMQRARDETAARFAAYDHRERVLLGLVECLAPLMQKAVLSYNNNSE